jgi:PmbA protein
LGGLVHALSGGALYRKSSFLLDSLGTQVLPAHIQVHEDPSFCVAKAVLRSMKKVSNLGPPSHSRWPSGRLFPQQLLGTQTRHAHHRQRWWFAHLVLESKLTQAHDDLKAMLKKLGTGLFVIELMGQGRELRHR